MKFSSYITLLILLISLTGCGGGGGSNPSPNQQTQIVVPPNQSTQQTVDNNVNVTIPATTFPQGSTITVTQSPTPTLPNQSITTTRLFQITSTAEPQDTITLTIPISVQAVGSGASGSWAEIEQTGGVWKVNNFLENTTGSLLATLTKLDFIGRGFDWMTQRSYAQLFPAPTVDIGQARPVLVAGYGPFGLNTLLYVHGCNDTYESGIMLCQRAVSSGKYSNAYAYSYDWRYSASDAANQLAPYLDQSIGNGCNVDIVAHSHGALVARYCLEVLGKTKPVRNACLLMGPNEGIALANTSDMIRLLYSDFLNNPNTSSDGLSYIPAQDSPALNDMIPNGSFISSLNSTHGQRGLVNYILVAGLHDKVVSQTSSLAQNTNIESFTQGSINRFTVDFAHSNILQSESGIAWILTQLKSTKSGSLIVESIPNPVENDGYDWPYTLKITNSSSEAIVIQDVSLDLFNRYGDWKLCQWFVDPGSGTYPYGYTRCNIPIAGGAVYTKNIVLNSHGVPISSAIEANKAYTVDALVRYYFASNPSITYYNRLQVIMKYGNIYPSTPPLRSPEKILETTRPEDTSCSNQTR